MSRKFNFSEGNFYHVYNRGTNKTTIFEYDADYWWFMHLLYHCNQPDPFNSELIDLRDDLNLVRRDTLVDIGTYCLMPNHFHLLLHEKTDGNISQFMHKLGTAYSMYFNLKNNRVGHLFEGPFKARHIDTDEYLQHVFAYISLNPAKLYGPEWAKNRNQNSNTLNQTMDYPFSSTKELIGTRKKYAPILQTQPFPVVDMQGIKFEKLIQWWNTTSEKY